MSAISQELSALDANVVAEECLNKLQLGEGNTEMESGRRSSIHSVTLQEQDSGHSTLVMDLEAPQATDESS